jgi:protein-L-isoaspartate(D-aspartate) O-methyltransferase
MSDTHFAAMMRQMMELIQAHTHHSREQIGRQEISTRVLEVMARIPRHVFVPVELLGFAYTDQPLPIGCGKTISQPFIVALMTDLLDIGEEHTVLEVGTGLGYHTSILAALAKQVYSIEVIEELALEAQQRLSTFGYTNIETRVANGENGWPEHAPFDRILVCAGSDLIPAQLLMQLKRGGKMVVPTGVPESQSLMLVQKSESGRTETKEILPVRFSLLESGDI